MAAPRPAAGAAPVAQQEYNWKEGMGQAVRSLAMMFAAQYAIKEGMKYFGFGPDSPAVAQTTVVEEISTMTGVDGIETISTSMYTSTITPASAVTTPPEAKDKEGSTVSATPPKPTLVTPAWESGTPFSMLLFVNTEKDVHKIDLSKPTVTWDGLTYGDWNDQREADLELHVPESVSHNNGSWYMDVVLVKGGGGVQGKGYDELANYRKQLTRWMPKRRVRKEKSLLGGDDAKEETTPEPVEDTKQRPIVAHWSKNLTLTVMSDPSSINLQQVHPAAQEYYQVFNSSTKPVYTPPIYPHDFWLLKENLAEINKTTSVVSLHVTYHAISAFKFQMFASLTEGFDQAAKQQGSGGEMDEIKRMLTETNPILLITTALVTVLHMVFEFLAFSNDVSHWRKKDKDLVGVSLRTILTNCFVQLVILLYLHDSSEETSWMILFTQGIGLLIEAWKVTKVVDIKLIADQSKLLGYRLSIEDKHELSEDEKKTQEYDRIAFRIVSYVAIPVLAGYALYSLKYNTYRSWYSFIVSTTAQAIYMFGFVQLVPQLIINYKLKSVAHIPMRAMVYKTLSTVVDDFFAFCVKMPWLHRLACFRDDLVFVILLAQMRIYRVDYTRANEYGQVTTEDAKTKGIEKAEIAEGAKPAENATIGEQTTEDDKLESKKDK